jgi:hypothetical protein
MSRPTELAMIGQGLAAGCISHGVTAVTANKMELEPAFRRAWRGWRMARRYGSIRADFNRNDAQMIIRDCHRRQSAYLATWVDGGGWYIPELRGEWDLADAEHLLSVYTDGAPWADWINLSGVFIDELGDDNIWRNPFDYGDNHV